MKTKKQKVIEALMNGDYKEALKIAKTFKIEFNKEQQSIIKRAYEMQWNPKFYESLGYDKEVEFQKAISILKETYLKNKELVQ